MGFEPLSELEVYIKGSLENIRLAISNGTYHNPIHPACEIFYKFGSDWVLKGGAIDAIRTPYNEVTGDTPWDFDVSMLTSDARAYLRDQHHDKFRSLLYKE